MERFSMQGVWQENGQYVEDEDDDDDGKKDGGETDHWLDALSEEQSKTGYKPFKPRDAVRTPAL